MLQVLAIKPSEDPTAYIAMLLGGMVLIYLGVLRPMMRKRKDPLEQPPRAAGLGQPRALEREMQHVLVEYEQMIRNMTAGLDTRAAKLELLISEADEKLAALRAANAGSGTTLRMTPVEVVSASAAAEDVMAPPREAPSVPDPRHAEVYALADEGLSPREVARRLGRPNGEIELILALRSGAE
jgi:DNA-binding NarL/FixJ family response regulator